MSANIYRKRKVQKVRRSRKPRLQDETGAVMTWREVAAFWNDRSGQRISHRRVMQIADKAMSKLQRELLQSGMVGFL